MANTQGLHNVYAFVEGSVGNIQSTYATNSITLDSVNPSLTVSNPTSTPAQSKTITASGSDTNGVTLTMAIGVSSTCDASRTFGAYSSTTFSSESDNGKYACYKAVDAPGNISYSLSAQIAGIDTTAPVITITNPNSTPAQSKTLTASPSDGTLTMSISTSTTCDNTRTFGAYSDVTFTTEADNGKYGCYKAIDTAGNISYSLSSVIAGIDTTAPVLSEVTPVTTPTSDTTPNYTFSTTETGSVTYSGACSSITTTASSGSNAITLDTLTDATYVSCKILVTDTAGNTSLALVMSSFNIDTTAPVITITNPNTSTQNSKTLTATGADVNTFTFEQSTTTGSTCDGSLSFSPYSSTTFSDPSDNGKKICYRAIDVVGNTSYSLSTAISGISRGPSISSLQVNSTTNPVGITTLYPIFSFTFSDPDIGDTQGAYP